MKIREEYKYIESKLILVILRDYIDSHVFNRINELEIKNIINEYLKLDTTIKMDKQNIMVYYNNKNGNTVYLMCNVTPKTQEVEFSEKSGTENGDG